MVSRRRQPELPSPTLSCHESYHSILLADAIALILHQRYVTLVFLDSHFQMTTSALDRPPTSDYLFGYGYSGFLSIQKAVDEYILSSALGERMYLNVSMGLFPEKVRFSPKVTMI